MTGKDLKLQRVVADLKVKDVAREMGVSDSRVSAIENSRQVTPETIDRYVRAIATLTTTTTPLTALA